jgi:hypothetical protein
MDETTTHHQPGPDRTTVVLRWIVGIMLGLLAVAGAVYGYAWFATPTAMRHPVQDHFHFRLQVINNGKPVNFADPKYQTEFSKDICSATLTKEPVHFHDNLDQFVHVHWQGITGGILLKTYGWNLIGGTKNTLGYRFDKFPQLQRVPVHGRSLPAPVAGSHYFVYTSTVADPTNYKKRDWNDFIHTDLKGFFNNQTAYHPGLLDALVPAAYAHGGSADEPLAELNHVMGNVVIFAQPKEPTADQVRDHFTHLVPLPESACAG